MIASVAPAWMPVNTQFEQVKQLIGVDDYTEPPLFDLSAFQENASNNKVGWSFLEHSENQIQLQPYDKWLLRRVINVSSLQQQMVS